MQYYYINIIKANQNIINITKMTQHTDYQRLRILQATLDIKQKTFVTESNVAQTSISRMVKGDIPISKRFKKYLYEKYKVNLEWLEYGIGSMFLESSENILQEPPAIYALKKQPTINQRFMEQWTVIAERNNTLTQRELCKKYGIADTDISKIKSNEVTPSKTILSILAIKANMNTNYTLAGTGTLFIEAGAVELHSKVLALIEENKQLKKNCQLLEENAELMRDKLAEISATKFAKPRKKTA
jgi:transcriptional regulator with XRE-family HTH domain